MRKKIFFAGLGFLVGGLTLVSLVFYLRVVKDQSKFPMLVNYATTTQPILLRNVSIYPGFGQTLLPKKDVLLDKGLIQTIAEGGTLRKAGARVIEGQGQTLLPGLVDTHVHLLSSGAAPWAFLFGNLKHNLQAYLRAGVTTVYELAGTVSLTQNAREHVRKGDWPGPRIYTTHSPITVPNGHPIPASTKLIPWPLSALARFVPYKIKKPEDAVRIIANLRKRNVDYVKIILDQLPPGSPEMSAPLVRALIKEAKRYGLKVFVHIGSAQNAVVAAEAGADVLAHGVYRDALTQAQAETIAKTGAKLIFTLAGFEQTVLLAKGTLEFTALEQLIHPEALLAPLRKKKGKQFLQTPILGDFARGLFKGQPHWHANIQKLYRAGVKFLIGTDSALPGIFPGSSFHIELAALHRAGLPTHELLTAATSRAAALLSPRPNYGTIAPQMQADLLLVEGNPLADLKHLQRIKAVIRKGRLVRFLPSSAR